ncbi:hypothetical protein AB0R01_30820 [Streptomyces rochei]|uniref:hypothetical protein n=1 Tax=Streptomyces TaxID=1883 RepID=UPI000AD1D294|nr:hypothetical protein [Streptomyces sp. MBT28]
MRRLPLLLTECILVGGIALGTAYGWLTLTKSRALSPGAVIVCTLISVALALVAEAAVHRARRGRPRRAHARPHHTGRTTP